MLLRRLEVLRRVDEEVFLEEEEAREFPSFEDDVLPVLPRDAEADLGRGPAPIDSLAEGVVEDVGLPGVEDQARERGEVDRLAPGSRVRARRRREDARLLRSDRERLGERRQVPVSSRIARRAARRSVSSSSASAEKVGGSTSMRN